jgi:class 3 adenylate cyclase
VKRSAADDSLSRLKARYELRLQDAARAHAELEKKVFHLKTLYDLSREIGFLNDSDAIIRNLLMMVLGTFGAERGLIVVRDAASNRINALAHRGLDNPTDAALALAQHHVAQPLESVDLRICIPFDVEPMLKGSIGLGEKLTGEDYTPDDAELLATLVNQAAVAIRNARAHEDIVRYAKELSDSLRRIQLLESMKASLGKFVPKTVKDLIEKSPDGAVLERREVDVSVLFADISGYTHLSAKMEIERLNQLVELYFGAFLDEILRLGGDVNETAGDGLMVIFQDARDERDSRGLLRADHHAHRHQFRYGERRRDQDRGRGRHALDLHRLGHHHQHRGAARRSCRGRQHRAERRDTPPAGRRVPAGRSWAADAEKRAPAGPRLPLRAAGGNFQSYELACRLAVLRGGGRGHEDRHRGGGGCARRLWRRRACCRIAVRR